MPAGMHLPGTVEAWGAPVTSVIGRASMSARRPTAFEPGRPRITPTTPVRPIPSPPRRSRSRAAVRDHAGGALHVILRLGMAMDVASPARDLLRHGGDGCWEMVIVQNSCRPASDETTGEEWSTAGMRMGGDKRATIWHDSAEPRGRAMLHPEAAKIWTALRDHKQTLEGVKTRDLFAQDSGRFAAFSFTLGDVLVDFSKNRVSRDTRALLLSLAKASCIEIRRDEMLAGRRHQHHENRAVLHTALRAPADADIRVDGRNVVPDVHEELARCYAFADAVRSGALRGATGDRIADVVNIGIGGSDLGPAMAARALSPYADGPRAHFVSNVDGADMADVLARLDPARTLFLVSSKNLHHHRDHDQCRFGAPVDCQIPGRERGRQPFRRDLHQHRRRRSVRHFQGPHVRFWDWVGGRYSMWSAIGLGLMIAIGSERFAEFLAGGRRTRRAFRQDAAGKQTSRADGPDRHLAPQHHGPCRPMPCCPTISASGASPPICSKLDMESNGKRCISTARRSRLHRPAGLGRARHQRPACPSIS